MNILIGLELMLLAFFLMFVFYSDLTFKDGLRLVIEMMSCSLILGFAIYILAQEVEI